MEMIKRATFLLRNKKRVGQSQEVGLVGREPPPTYDDSSSSATTENSTPDNANKLNHLCANAEFVRPGGWDTVREWLSSHADDEIRVAAKQQRDKDSNMTALHFCCRNQAPLDVIDIILSIAGETVQLVDSFGWLPIHYACACGATEDVTQRLAEAYPESASTVDRRGRTPLHLVFGIGTVSPHIVALLSSTGAASYADDNGMLPLHCACANGSSEECIYNLTQAYPAAVTTQDSRGRTPLHFISWGHRSSIHSLYSSIHSLYILGLSLVSQKQDLGHATSICLSYLDQLNESIPPRYLLKAKFVVSSFKLRRRLSGMSDEDLLTLPRMTNADKLDAMKLYDLVYSIWFCQGKLRHAALASVRMMQLTLAYGMCQDSPIAYACWGAILAGNGNLEEGYRFGKLALQLVEESASSRIKERVTLILNDFTRH